NPLLCATNNWHHTLYFPSYGALEKQILSLSEHLDVISNMHFKNRGAGTGFSATSWTNTKGFHLDFIAGWCDYNGWKKSPDEFYQNNILCNFGDDSIGITLDLKNMDTEKLKACMAKYNIYLDFDVFNHIEQIQYLGSRALYTHRHTIERGLLDTWKRARLNAQRQTLKQNVLSKNPQQTKVKRWNKLAFWIFAQQNKLPSFYQVMNIHMDIKTVFPEKYLSYWNKFLKEPQNTDYSFETS
ncbi:3670_t:CDS:1, partial [Dentiscutata heterogama]